MEAVQESSSPTKMVSDMAGRPLSLVITSVGEAGLDACDVAEPEHLAGNA